jgi:DNA-binding response OmpR family regulator
MTRQTIVVANDDPAYLSMIKDVLIEEGYPNVHCIAGSLSFDFIQQEQPDLVLLDINITNPAQGWKTLDFLRLHRATTKIPVIVCSTDGRVLREKADMLYAMRCETLEKPFDIDVLLEKVQAIIGPPPERTGEAAR